jgi:hypothetical protein
MREARALSMEIDSAVMEEDKHMCELHYEANASRYWQHALLGDSEKAVREHHDMLRSFIPELDSEHEPESF